MHSMCINLRLEFSEPAGTRDGSTFGGGPFVSTVAGHVFDRLSDPVLLARGRENGEWLGESLRALAARRDEIRAVRGVGYLWGIDVTRPASEIVASAREAGLLILTAGDYTLRLLLPITEERVVLALEDFIVAVDVRGRVRACGALKEYSPSLAEVASLAVARRCTRRRGRAGV